MSFFDKIKWVLGILVVFLLVLATNLIDRQNFRDVRESIEAIYADRVVAQNLLFRISKVIHEKELAYTEADRAALDGRLSAQEGDISAAVDRFAGTRLTEQESVEFGRLQKKLATLASLEADLVEGKAERREVRNALEGVRESLDDLSAIQLQEGRQQLLLGQRAISSSDLFAQLEIGALVVLALAIQGIILYSPGQSANPRATERS
ncbi:MCP four helix bundle domain-containing protein [Lewinella sp. IMCC34191]|uniref:MCP four helix bundle domain-containing protein n=1 Tax=Lewinella sp. IMCC34191 TaxID=2259172 RepID=UPI000E243D77|nr:MCP four helix bundle domain-containing protein [Lewinella sp. IMCC34191]